MKVAFLPRSLPRPVSLPFSTITKGASGQDGQVRGQSSPSTRGWAFCCPSLVCPGPECPGLACPGGGPLGFHPSLMTLAVLPSSSPHMEGGQEGSVGSLGGDSFAPRTADPKQAEPVSAHHWAPGVLLCQWGDSCRRGYGLFSRWPCFTLQVQAKLPSGARVHCRSMPESGTSMS